MHCLGCAPHPDGIILTSRNYLHSLKSDKHTCPFHRRLVNKHCNSAHKYHHTVESPLQPDKVDTLTDHDNMQPLHQVLSGCNNEGKAKHNVASSLQAKKKKVTVSSSVLTPVTEDPEIATADNSSVVSSHSNGNSIHSQQELPMQDITNTNALKVFDYNTPIKYKPRPTQLINVKVSYECF